MSEYTAFYMKPDFAGSPQSERAPFIYSPPDFENMSKSEEIKWREQEIERWSEGYTIPDGPHKGYHVCAPQYFELTQTVIRLGRYFARPWWRDIDDFIWNSYENARKEKRDIYYFKRRRASLTSKFIGSEPLRLSLVEPGSMCGFTSCDEDRGRLGMNDKFMVAFNHFDKAWNFSHLTAGDLRALEKANGLPDWWVFRKGVGSRDGHRLRFEFFKKEIIQGEKGNVEKLVGTNEFSEVYYEQTSKSEKDATAFEGATLSYLFVDEFFLHRFANKVRNSAEAALSDGFVKEGTFVTGGSAGDMSHQGVENARKIIEAHATGTSDDIVVFVPGWMGIDKAEEYDEDGRKKKGSIINLMHGYAGRHQKRGKGAWVQQYAYSKRGEAEDWIEKNRAILKKKNDQSELRQFTKAYPLSLDEILDTGGESLLSDDIMAFVRQQKKEIMNNLNDPTKVFAPYDLIMKDGQIIKRSITK